ncbi:NUDIX hydrolase [Aurantimonas sp. VKM B-3413]|uniref:NUDIX hydrolase n=1 Tax=Aurantimonas sp. VKM B-3413 TaxID=2779401 RepID=UPI001E358157|nr:NUDIX hydrolase [Aurantimonas sp. VKM B-3413]MCB8840785.1 NUDIX hydrolase [Aurantimonas sp. VKM B-3413]
MAKTKRRKQVAALPYRLTDDGALEVLMVTSRDTGRWVLPKGWPMKRRRKHQAAAIEAFEEAGVVGKARKTAIGSYEYYKRTECGDIPCRVLVYPLPVVDLQEEWPESHQRTRRWHDPKLAAELVDEPHLQSLLLAFGERRRPS